MFFPLGFAQRPAPRVTITPPDAFDKLVPLSFTPERINGVDFVDTSQYEIGTRFTPTETIEILGVWLFYKESAGATVKLWEGTTNVVTQWSGALVDGWNFIEITPYIAQPETEYTVSYNVETWQDSFYTTTPFFFDDPVQSIQGLFIGTGGFFATTPGNYPTESWQNSFYSIHPRV